MAATVEYPGATRKGQKSRFKLWIVLPDNQTRTFFSMDRVINSSYTEYGRQRLEKWVPNGGWRDPIKRAHIYDLHVGDEQRQLVRVLEGNAWRDATDADRGIGA